MLISGRSVSFALLLLMVYPAEAATVADQDPRVSPVVLAYRSAKPAIVNISTTRLVRVRYGLFRSQPFEDMFPNLFPRRKMSVRSLGSGFVINPSGYIVTNAHVVRQAEKISVTFPDNTKCPAEVISADPDLDLAVLKIDPPDRKQLSHLPLGRSEDLMVGETVIAVGNPLGYTNTLTTGVVSATNRTLPLSEDVEIRGLIQTDAPINPGSSGGPLLNIKGELIGINTAIRGDAQNIGFAIPVDRLADELTSLLDAERLNRVVFGASVTQRHGDDGDRLVVTEVRAGTPAEGKLALGDRLVALNGKQMCQISDYACAMLDAKAGARLTIALIRDGRELARKVTLAAKPKPDGNALARRHFGMTLRVVTPQLARDLRLRVDRGLLVTRVERGSPADLVGIEPEDVVFQLGRLYVTDLDTLGTILEDLEPGQTTMIGIVRGNVSVSGSITARLRGGGSPERN